MDAVKLELDARTVTGKAVKHLRREGIVPAVIHDHGKDSLVVQADYQNIYHAYQKAGKHHPVELKVGDKAHMALIKHATFDPKKNSLTHVVFNAVKRNEKVTAEIPVHARYDEGNESSPAERASLIVLHNLETVEVEAVASQLPDALYFDGEKLVEVGDHATVADLVVPNGVTIKTDPAQALATVYEPSALQAANDAAGGDATEEDQEEVPAEHESTAEEGTQAPEDQPGGKKQFEPSKE
ncbi:MAG TPA: 50S ribosomal protein L25 [Candidatus Saccharimonadales bacterium]|nr:50S ribosomal protein L25 [Candidatus Saccharimonadales bacterium]